MEGTVLVWEWPIWVYLWAAGVAGGAYFATFLVNLFTRGKHKRLVQIAIWLGLPLVLVGVLMLVVDLGHQTRAWHLFVRFYPISPMSLGSWILLVWAIVAVILIALWLSELFEAEEEPSGLFPRFAALLRPLVPAAGILGWIELVLSVLLITYTGVLLSNTNTALWASLLLPVLFVVSAVATGMAATLLLATLFGIEIPPKFGQASTVLEVLEILALVAFLITVPASVLVSGTLALWFWLGVIVVGMFVPVALELLTWRTSPRLTVAVATAGILLGGLVLRAVIVIGGQI